MSRTSRLVLFAVAACALAVPLVAGLVDLPAVGTVTSTYADAVNERLLQGIAPGNAVSSVVFDLRGFDTLIEELILMAAATGVAALLRARADDEKEEDKRRAPARAATTSTAVQVATLAAVPLVLTLGAYVVVHGHLTPGGGFQGGAVLATVPVLLFLGGHSGRRRAKETAPHVETTEGAGIAGFVAVGAAGLIVGDAFLQNVLPLGDQSSLLSGGVIPVLNVVVAVAVSAGVVVLALELLKELRSAPPTEGSEPADHDEVHRQEDDRADRPTGSTAP